MDSVSEDAELVEHNQSKAADLVYLSYLFILLSTRS